MENPSELKYTKDHEWVKVEGDIAVIGITDHAQEQLTDIVFVELPEKGKEVESGNQMATIESVKSVSDVFAPVSGTIEEVNQAIVDSPDLVNKDAFANWFVKIKMKDKSEADKLMSKEEYDNLIKG